MRVDEFDYDLPEELIAQTPLADRAASRLMVVDPVANSVTHARFSDIKQYLRRGDVLVFNNSKVLPARLYGVKQDTGARVELLLVRRLGPARWTALAKPAKRLRTGARIQFPTAVAEQASASAEVIGVQEDGLRVLEFHIGEPMEAFLERCGTMPLPPYIRTPLAEPARYQTVYADPVGSVAAPTAGLHFTPALLDDLRAHGVELRFVTLHVGLGTFRPVQVDEVERHQMHSEECDVSEETAAAINHARREGRRIIAVGTTALRTLESAARDGELVPGRRETDIFIYPGYRFQLVDALITNFHLPRSTLLMLVAAMMGIEFTRRVYREAVGERYRFFSFGDAMFITRRVDNGTQLPTL